MALLRRLRPVFASGLPSGVHAGGVQGPANHVVSNTRKVANATAANQNHMVLLKIMVDPRDIGRNLSPVRETYPRDLP